MAVQIKKEDLRKMQLMQVEMIKEFDRVCKKHNIHYAIYGGTLLGAVRHKGFIPWDDDMDIAMLRRDYERFKRHINELDSSICYFQDHEIEKEYIWGYGKLRRTGTVFQREGQEHLGCRTGVFIDIVPFDDMPENLLHQILIDLDTIFLRKILWSRVAVKSAKGLSKIAYGLLSKISVEFVHRRYRYYACKRRNTGRVRIISLASMGYCYHKNNPFSERFSIPDKWVLDTVTYDFESVKLPGARDYDGFLCHEYCDYMALPPKEKRVPQLTISYYKI